ncbi:MAG: endonuclease [Gammaproteobacteria bacterium]|jgi:endonuclease/exonuclease/phosphatase family metal-dependent hydrolase|nr:endonuclease [Gammaproteobacteria bacterium]
MQDHRIRVLTYNIHVGMGAKSAGQYWMHVWHHLMPHPRRRDNLLNIAHFIAPYDLVGLQELDGGSFRSGHINQIEFLAEHGGFLCQQQQTTRDLGLFAQHGKGLLSRFPVHAIQEYPLPSKLPGRGIVTFCIGDVLSPLFVVNVHLSLSKKAQAKQFDFIAELTSNYKHVIVMGDFNAEPDFLMEHPSIKASGLHLANQQCLTYPSWKPKKQIDFILVSPSILVVESGMIQCEYSDHLPVYAELIIPEEVRLPVICPIPDMNELD